MPATSTPDPDSTRDFRRAYREHYGLVWHALHRFGVPAHSLEDATQDTFVVAYRRRQSTPDVAIKAWLYGIARRIASNYRRCASRRLRKVEALSVTRAAVHSDATAAYEAVHALDRYLSSLPSRDRELFVLSEIEGMTGPEIAQSMGGNLNTMYSRLRQLRRRFDPDAATDTPPDLRRVAAQRPRATARSWALLLPALAETPVAFTTGLTALLSNKLVGAGLGACVAAGALVAVAQPSAPAAPTVASASIAVSQPEPEPAGPSRDRTATRRPSAVPRPIPPVAIRPATSVDTPPARVASPPAPSPPSDSDLATQNRELRAASDALLSGDAGQALQITLAQRQRFPASPLLDLQVALEVEALCALGRNDNAALEARRFLDAHPSSAVVARIRRSCIRDAHKPTAPDTAGL